MMTIDNSFYQKELKVKTEITRLGNLLNPIHFKDSEKRKEGKNT